MMESIDMYRGYAMVRELARVNPLPLLDLTDKKLIRYAESLLPYSIGIEFECALKEGYSSRAMIARKNGQIYAASKYMSNSDIKGLRHHLPYVMAISTDGDEQRFRIPKGIKGLVCLYKLSLFMKEYYGLNTDSGIHYHVDFTHMPEWWEKMKVDTNYRALWINENNPWVIESLKKWGYKGTYNSMLIKYDGKEALKLHSTYKTLEYRIGEMTFEYELLFKRISNCCSITSKLQKDLLSPRSLKVETKLKAPKVVGKINPEELLGTINGRTRGRRTSDIYGNDIDFPF